MTDRLKLFYMQHHESIIDARYNSPFWIQRYVLRQGYAGLLSRLEPGQRVLDAGCGEGLLACLAARRGVDVVGVDISGPNIEAARRLARQWGVRARFVRGDAERLPFPDGSFDVVISSHVIEHLPDPERGLLELFNVTRGAALIAMPACLNPASWALLGGDDYWRPGRRSLVAVPLGFARTLVALFQGKDGCNEDYGGHQGIPHSWLFPWAVRRMIREAGFRVVRTEANSLLLPYLAEYLPPVRSFQRLIDRWRAWPFLRDFGYGLLAVCEKVPQR